MTDAVDVELRDITKAFGDFTAVRDVSFAVPRGTFFSILGPSGCGKTTLLNLISGFQEPTAGEVWIAGQRVNGVPPNRRKVNMVFQRLALFPLMTVFDNVAFGLRMAKVPQAQVRSRVMAMLETVGLTGMERRLPSQLSGGQQQRVAIARCLVLEPAVVLLDEPLSALDLKLREHMKLQLKHLQREVGTTFVYITHDQSEAMVMSDRIAVMNEGQVLQVGAPDEIYSLPCHPFVASFVGESNTFQGTVVELSEDSAIVKDGAVQMQLSRTPDMAVGQSYLQFLRPENVRLLPLDGDRDRPENQVRGRVQSVIFDGAIVRCLVNIGRDRPLTTLFTRGTTQAVPYVGETVRLGWRAADVIAFPAQHRDQMMQLQKAQFAEV
ncbi:MAG: ABC transporter ATP-binding protein [Leptolyngbyaceae cyanobacterium T60_A2020_046]|nr:ABC transporter ATP-binding protein [Leptolyngbyaceae cyanobacterium T60_A2020_046]